ncbi:acyl carrier protein [compost metagenome]
MVSHNRLFLARARQSAVEIRDSHADVALDELLGTVSKVMPMPIAQAATQRQLADILRVVLNLPEHVAISADSHLRDELGLDSLTSMELLVSLEDDIEGFFVNPDTITPGHFKTVASLAGYIDAHRQVPTGRRAVEAIEVHHEGV